MIEVRNITKYHLRETVLDDVSFDVAEGTQLGLLGPGGAGKTLLTKIITGLVKPDGGYVKVDGVDVHSLGAVELATLRAKIGMLFQNYALFDFMTVQENIAFPLQRQGGHTRVEMVKKVNELLAEIGLKGTNHQYPRELSGGMKKRVTFARAVVHQPPILFYDDPTMGLDPVTSSKIFIMLERMRKRGVTSICITHDVLGVRDICDTFALLDKGRLILEGSRADFENSDVRLVRQFWDGTSD